MGRRDRPNIVWLLTDHHVFRHHGAAGGPRPALPTYERLVREGVEFPNACAVCPLCTPARASMLTGVYPHRHGMLMNNGDCGSRLDFEPETRLFSHFLRQAGYRAGYFGKWHCGERLGPLDFGFEGWSMLGYGHPYWTEEYAASLERRGLPQATVDVEWHFGNREHVARGVVLRDEPSHYRLMESCGVLTTPVETHESYFVADLASRWLEERAHERDPFCLRVDVWGPHQPYFVGAPFAGTVDPREIPEYPSFSAALDDRPALHRRFRDTRHQRATIHTWEEWQPVVARAYEHATQVDCALGRVVDALDRLGLADNTLVLYTADHGDAIGSNGGVFDKDSMMVEETMRIPMALRWPGRVPAGEARPHLASNMDLVATLLDAAGAPRPEPLDGASLLGPARDPDAPWRDALLCQHHGHGRPAFQRFLRRGPWKYVAHLDDLDELYHLERDPCESRNLARDPSMAGVLAEMRERLAREMEAVGDESAESGGLVMQVLG